MGGSLALGYLGKEMHACKAAIILLLVLGREQNAQRNLDTLYHKHVNAQLKIPLEFVSDLFTTGHF